MGDDSVGVGAGDDVVGVGEGEVSVGVGDGDFVVGVGEGDASVGVGDGVGVGVRDGVDALLTIRVTGAAIASLTPCTLASADI